MSLTIESRLADIRRRIKTACESCGRETSAVTLVAVSKRQPLERIQAAIQAGHRCFGENQVQEAVAKASVLPADTEWHMIGPLQSNKVKPAARLFDVVHSVDRVKIARLLSKEAGKLGRNLDVFLQVNVGSEPTKHGFSPEAFESEARDLIELPAIEIVGLMAIPPYEEDPEKARRWFQQLAKLRDTARSWPEWEGFEGRLSMGMSHDFEIAIEEGATHIRVGTDIFGPRAT